MKRMACDTLIIGSGPGGAMTGALLAEAGIQTPIKAELLVLPRQDAKDISQVVQQQAKAAGEGGATGR